MDPEVKKQLKSLRKLRSCARPNSGRAGVLEDDVKQLQKKCRDNITEWGKNLEGVNLDALPAPLHPQPLDLKERLTKMLKKYMNHAERDERHEELKGILRDAHQELGGDPQAPAIPALPPPAPPPGLPPPVEEQALHVAHIADPETQARIAMRDRVESLYPEQWSLNADENAMKDWEPMNWSARDLKDISEALDRKNQLGGRLPPEAAGGLWPSLTDSYQVKPACDKYKKKEDCVWPCAYKSGNRDPNKMCRPARTT